MEGGDRRVGRMGEEYIAVFRASQDPRERSQM